MKNYYKIFYAKFSKHILNILKYIIIAIILSSFIVFAVQTFEIIHQNLELSINSDGIQYLVSQYHLTMQFVLASIAVMTLWIYVKRIKQNEYRLKQTNDELNLLHQNNRFNTYIKHREEFYAHFTGEQPLKYLHKRAGVSERSMLRYLHKEFYGATYTGFSNSINERSIRFGDSLNIYITDVGLDENLIDLEKFDKEKVNKLDFIKGYKFQEYYLTYDVIEMDIRQKGKGQYRILENKVDYLLMLIKELSNIKLLYEIYNTIGEFEGEIFARDPKQFKYLDRDNIINRIQNYEFINTA